MANNYLTPGIYVQEISTLPGIVAEVQSAIPAFIGYTEKVRYDGRSLMGIPEYITSFKDFEERFGGAAKLALKAVTIKTDNNGRFSQVDSVQLKKRFLLYEAMYTYFQNGGGQCYVVSLGSYEENGPDKDYDKTLFLAAIEALEAVDDITLLVMPEAALLGDSFYSVQQAALKHCAKRMNRFAILDIKEHGRQGNILLNWQNAPEYDKWRDSWQEFRDRIGIMNLSYGAAYTPYIVADTPTSISYRDIKDFLFDADKKAPDEDGAQNPLQLSLVDLDPGAKKIIQKLECALVDRNNLMEVAKGAKQGMPGSAAEKDDVCKATDTNIERLVGGLQSNSMVYRSISSAVQTALRVQPPSASMAGIYASTDRARGVWKAPANVSLSNVLRLTQTITAEAQEVLNSDSVAGKSINALRSFPGKGYLVWGARTLDGNSQEWRYIPVRRFFIMVEESVRRATTWVVSEPNDATLWAKVKALIDNYLLQKWKDGALQGASPAEAYFVNVGLGSTMTEQDILEGRLIVDIGMAAVRPAEFIILRFMHKMNQS